MKLPFPSVIGEAGLVIHMVKKRHTVNVENLKTIASDAIQDITYSLITDIISKLEKENLLTDISKVIDIVDQVTQDAGLEGIRLRRANIERRNNARKQGKTIKEPQKTITWVSHPKDKKLEYSVDAEVGRRYILRKAGSNHVVGLLDKNKIKDKKSGYGLKDEKTYVIGSAEQLMLNTRGFQVDKKTKKIAYKEITSDEEESEEENLEEESEEENLEEESEEIISEEENLEEESEEEIIIPKSKSKSKKRNKH